MEKFYRTLMQLALAILVVAGLATNRAQAQVPANIGDQFKVTVVEHSPNGDIHRDDAVYTFTFVDGNIQLIQNANGTPLAMNEPFPNYVKLPAVLANGSFAVSGPVGCWWDVVRSIFMLGDFNGPDVANLGKSYTISFRQQNGATVVLSQFEFKLIGGFVVPVETYRMHKANGQPLDAGFPYLGQIPIYRAGEFGGKQVWKTNPLWWRLDMDTAFFHAVGSYQDFFGGAVGTGTAGLIFGYDVTMMNCPTTPILPPGVSTGKFKTPEKFICDWDCITSRSCDRSPERLMIFFPNEDRVSNALDRPELVRRYLQGQYGDLWAEYIAVQLQAERLAFPGTIYNASLVSLTRGNFKTFHQLSFGLAVSPTATLRELLNLIRMTRNILSEDDRKFFAEVLSYINWDTTGLGTNASRNLYPDETRTGVAARDGEGRGIANNETPVAVASSMSSTRQAVSEPQTVPPPAIAPTTIKLEPVQNESTGLTTFRFEQTKTPAIAVPAHEGKRTVRIYCTKHHRVHVRRQ